MFFLNVLFFPFFPSSSLFSVHYSNYIFANLFTLHHFVPEGFFYDTSVLHDYARFIILGEDMFDMFSMSLKEFSYNKEKLL